MNKRVLNEILICILLILFMDGCAVETTRELVRPVPETKGASPLPDEVLDQKIASLNGRLKSEMLNKEQEEVARSLIDGLKKISKASQGDVTIDDYHIIIALLFDQLNKLEDKYLTVPNALETHDYSETITLFTKGKNEIRDSYLSGNLQDVIIKCVELEAKFGPDSLTPEIGLLFALSLAEKGMYNDALNIGKRIMPELEGRPDLIHLRAGIIHWLLAMDHKDQASAFYEKLVDSVDEREAILARIKKEMTGETEKIVQQEEAPLESVPMAQAIRQNEPMNLDDVLEQVNRLVESHSFAEAKVLLIKWRLGMEAGPEIETVDQALKTVELAEEMFQKKQIEEKKSLETAMNLIEKENFVEAIRKLDELKTNPEITPETEKLRDLAVEKLINRERDKAAKIYLMAKKSKDPNQRKELLIASQKIIQTLIREYPQSTLINKLKNNLESINKDLKEFQDRESDVFVE
jgi:hypothetical protein